VCNCVHCSFSFFIFAFRVAFVANKGIYAPEMTTGDGSDEFDEDDDLSLSHLLPADVMFDEYASVDDNVETCEQPTDDEIVDAVMAAAEPGSAAASDEQEEEEGSRRRSTSQVVHRLSRRWTPCSVTCWVSVTVTKPR